MKKFFGFLSITAVVILMGITTFTGCGLTANRDAGRQLAVEIIGDGEIPEDIEQVIDPKPGPLSPIFSGKLGVPISKTSMGAVDPDPSGHTASDDYDGDSIPNAEEITTNPYVANYPRIITSVTTPITIEIRRSKTDRTLNYEQEIEDDDTVKTTKNFTSHKTINSLNNKTVPLETVQSINENSGSDMYGDSAKTYDEITDIDEDVISDYKNTGYRCKKEAGCVAKIPVCTSQATDAYNTVDTDETNEYEDHVKEWNESDQSEKTIFGDQEFKDDTTYNDSVTAAESVETNSLRFRKSLTQTSEVVTGTNAGFVRAGLYIKNATANMPVRITNVVCTLSFSKNGITRPISTFRLRNENFDLFAQDVMGGEELGPYTIEVEDLNTLEAENALRNGYLPQIHIVSYDMRRVEGSRYNPLPDTENLKIVEETAKGRTAIIKISGKDVREFYRVVAFDVTGADANGNNGRISPGISLKKALFNLLGDRIGDGERWTVDRNGKSLTVTDEKLVWKAGISPANKPEAGNPDRYLFNTSVKGNFWRNFETYVKTYTTLEKTGTTWAEVTHHVETIKRIGDLERYDPFNKEDNEYFDPHKYLDESEIFKMKYWIILHNGQYFEGDLNDPIWAGERYEVVCVDIGNFNEQYQGYQYLPLQTQESFAMDTRWNRLTNDGEFARAMNLGKVIFGDMVKLQVQRALGTSLFDPQYEGREFGTPVVNDSYNGLLWYDYKYRFKEDKIVSGMLSDFNYDVIGGKNCIILNIKASENAQEYRISWWETNAQPSSAVSVDVDAEYLGITGGVYVLNQKTAGLSGLLTAGTYEVRVKAIGQYSGISISKQGTGNFSSAVVTEAAAQPADFTFSASGGVNVLDVIIGSNIITDAEYYEITVKGPYNYGFKGDLTDFNDPDNNTTVPTEPIYGQQGINRVTIPVRHGQNELLDEEKNFTAAGIYTVQVKAVNNAGARLLDPETVLVNYDGYAEQKRLLPAATTDPLNLQDVELEVNFNDGTGWYKLKLSADDNMEGEQYIDCRYSSTYSASNQLVDLYFQPPDWVFINLNSAVDVYVRPVAKPEYRDSLWIKPNTAKVSLINPDATNNVYYNRALDVNPLDYGWDILGHWMGKDYTDATKIKETAAASKIYSSYTQYFADSGADDIGLVNLGVEDFFFAPASRNVYVMQAALENFDENAGSPNTFVDMPAYRAVGGDKHITVSDFDSRFGVTFVLYWRRGAFAVENEKFCNADGSAYAAGGWNRVDVPNIFEDTNIEVDGPGKYKVCVVAKKTAAGETYTSKPAFKEVQVFAYYNNSPVANAGDDQTGYLFETVQLYACDSEDAEDDQLLYDWKFLSVPAGSNAYITDTKICNPTFLPDMRGIYSVQVTVEDGYTGMDTDEVLIDVALNHIPVADAGPDRPGYLFDTIQLTAGGSRDADGDTLSYTWELVSRPEGSGATISNPVLINPTFYTDKRGTYIARVTVTDGFAGVDTAEVRISVDLNHQPAAAAGPDETHYYFETVQLNADGSSDADGDTLSYTWDLVSWPEGSGAAIPNRTIINPTFKIDKFGTYVAKVTVIDGYGGTASDTVDINVVHKSNENVDVQMVEIMGGRFELGHNGDPNDNSAYNIENQHPVLVDNFELGKFEVTFYEWSVVKDWAVKSGYTFRQGSGILGNDGQAGSLYDCWEPVTTVTWNDCVAWCNALSEMEELTPVYYETSAKSSVYRDANKTTVELVVVNGNGTNSNNCVLLTANGYRLPTEAEWEFTAKDGLINQGYFYSGSNSLSGYAVYNTNKTYIVGNRAPNLLGIYDMTGNVAELVWDWYGAYTAVPAVNPMGPAIGNQRIVRGGYFGSDPHLSSDIPDQYDELRNVQRSSQGATSPSNAVGFRVCRRP